VTSEHRIDPAGRPYEPAALEPKPEVDVAAFAALDLRVGRIVDAAPFPEARTPSLKLWVDFGPVLGVRATAAKVANYDPERLPGRQVVGAMNLGSRRIAGFRSEFLVLGGLEPDGTVRLLLPDGDLDPGSAIA
jgi:tRNA-binding protein